MDFFPASNQQQTEENFSKTFLARELPEVVTFRGAQAGKNAKKVRGGISLSNYYLSMMTTFVFEPP